MIRFPVFRVVMGTLAGHLLPMITAQIAELREHLGALAEQVQANDMMLAADEILRRRVR